MSGRPDPAFGDRSGGAATGRWSDPADDAPDPVDDGIAVGVPPLERDLEHGPAGGSPDGAEGPGGVPGEQAGLRAERDQYLESLQRLQADFENYRKRVQRQQEEQAARAAGDLVGKLLPVLDTLDLARAHLLGADGDGGADPVSEGAALEQARAQLLDLLVKEGLERVDGAGVAFDPVIHDAVAHAPTAEDDPAGSVVVDQVLRAGYRWRGQVLRPAMVRVRG